MALANGQEQDLLTCQQMVEGVIEALNLPVEDSRLKSAEGSLGWGLMRGSAHVYIFLRPTPETAPHHLIQILAPVIKLPQSAENQNALFRRLLEMNANTLNGVAFGIKSDTVLLCIGRSTRDLDPSEVKEMILKVGFCADHFDDALVTHFGGERFADL